MTLENVGPVPFAEYRELSQAARRLRDMAHERRAFEIINGGLLAALRVAAGEGREEYNEEIRDQDVPAYRLIARKLLEDGATEAGVIIFAAPVISVTGMKTSPSKFRVYWGEKTQMPAPQFCDAPAQVHVPTVETSRW